MKGARAEPPPKTIITPIKSKMTIIGANHHFFLDFMNRNKSLIKSISFL